MSHRRTDVVRVAIAVLDDYGLADLTMRRLGRELDVQPSALYHHFATKQLLLAAVADEILERGRRDRRARGWEARVREICEELRDAMLAYRDGAEVVATVHAFGLGAARPGEELETALADSGLGEPEAGAAARTLLHFIFGSVAEEQTQLQAASAGVVEDVVDAGGDFATGLELILAGIGIRIRA